MRTAFIKQLVEEAKHNNKIFLIVGDLGFNVVEEFAEQFPERFINVGIAEQNMVGVASGLAMEGYIVYIYSIGNFPTLRCMEQIRNDIAYPNLNVKIVAVGGGYAYGSLGVSHHATEELGMLRTIPNMTICAPGDPIETVAVTTYSATYDGPMYLRLGKAGEPVVHSEKIENLQAGDILPIIQGRDIAILSTGSMLDYAYHFVNEHQLKVSLYSCPFVKPLNRIQLKEIASKYATIITLEEHQVSAGFGSAVLERYNDLVQTGELITFPTIKRIAIPDIFYSISGSQNFLRNVAGLKLDSILTS